MFHTWLNHMVENLYEWSIGTKSPYKLFEMDNATAGKQNAGDYVTRDEVQTGALVGIAGAIGGGLLTLGSTVFTKTLDTGEEVTKTVSDVFDDIGDFLDSGGSGGLRGAFRAQGYCSYAPDILTGIQQVWLVASFEIKCATQSVAKMMFLTWL